MEREREGGREVDGWIGYKTEGMVGWEGVGEKRGEKRKVPSDCNEKGRRSGRERQVGGSIGNN